MVLDAYDRWGTDVLLTFLGMFALWTLDVRRRKLVLARNRFGKKPIHFNKTPTGLVFGSKLTALTQHPDTATAIDRCALVKYFSSWCDEAPGFLGLVSSMLWNPCRALRKRVPICSRHRTPSLGAAHFLEARYLFYEALKPSEA